MTNTILNLNQLGLIIEEGLRRNIVTPQWAQEANVILAYETSEYFNNKIHQAQKGNRASIRHCLDILKTRGRILDVIENVALSID